MAKLYELDNALEAFVPDIDDETGEILNIEELEALELERSDKIENICLWIKNLQADAKAYRNEKKVFMDKISRTDNLILRLSTLVKDSLAGEKFNTSKVSVSYRKSERVEIDPNTIIPEEFLNYKEPAPDKEGLKKAIKAGQVIKGVRLEEYQNMSIK